MKTELIENIGFKQYSTLFLEKNEKTEKISVNNGNAIGNLVNRESQVDQYMSSLSVLAIISIYLFCINNHKEYSLILNTIHNTESEPENFKCLSVAFDPEMSFDDVLFFLKKKLTGTSIEIEDRAFYGSEQFKIGVVFYNTNTQAVINAENYLDFIFAIDIQTHEISISGRKKRTEYFFNTIIQQLKIINKQAFTNRQQSIKSFSYISNAEKMLLKQWNRTKTVNNNERTIPQLIENICESNPKKIAVCYGQEKIGYRHLNKLSDGIANQLMNYGLEHQDRVAIFFSRSISMIAAIFAVLKAGLVYVPIDIQYPANRIKTIIDDSNTKIILTEQKNVARLDKIVFNRDVKIQNIDDLTLDSKIISDRKTVQAKNTVYDIAYIIYTSGSTGKPKGVKVTHDNILNYAFWFARLFHLEQASVMDFSSSIGFDISVPCTLVPLLAGAQIAVCSEEIKLDPSAYIDFLRYNKVTHVELTPDYFSHLLEFSTKIKNLNDLQWILLGADTVMKKDIEQWLALRPHDFIINEYGPTECTVAVTAEIITQENIKQLGMSVPIGKISDNNQAYVLDRYLNICPIGVCGELYIGGRSVSQGYLDEEQTKNVFIDNPFKKKKEIIYNTGDIVRWLPNGSLEHRGREDTQIKIRGHRIELQEIEHQILQNKNIKQAKVLLHEDTSGKFLVAYVINAERKIMNIDALKHELKKSLPYYMLPKEIVFYDVFPVNSSGKIDVREMQTKYVSYKKEMTVENSEKLDTSINKLINLFKELFNNDAIDLDDDFFELGGNSLLAVKLINAIEKFFSIKIELYQLFEYSKINELWNLMGNFQTIVETAQSSYSDFFPKLIKLTKNRHKKKLFLLPPVGGTVFVYKDLSKFLSKHFDVYGLQDVVNYTKERHYSSIEEMATYCLHIIRSVQTEGSYYLAGSSFGATLAVEIARQLELTNHSVAFLGLFDGWPYYSNKLLDENFFHTLMYSKLKLLTKEEAKKFLDAQYIKERMLFEYQIPNITAPITLFKAQDVLDIFKKFDDRTNNWSNFISGNIKVHVISGDHESMLYDENAKNIASIICSTVSEKENYVIQ